MDVLVGPTPNLVIDEAYVRGNRGVTAKDEAVPAVGLLMAEESGRGGAQVGLRGGVDDSPAEESSESSSSIGSPGESSDNDEDDAVSSQGGLGSFTSLEESLPIKGGLSRHYTGKSKSFGNLMEARSVKDLEKVENPLNRKRRLLIADKLRRSRRPSSSSSQFYYALKSPNSMPLLALQESQEHDSGDDERTKLQEEKLKNSDLMMAQTQSCFCLSSLQEEDE